MCNHEINIEQEDNLFFSNNLYFYILLYGGAV